MATTMNETVVVKIVGDTTDIERKTAGVTKNLKTMGKTGSNSLGMSAEAADQLHNSLASIRGMSFTGLVAQIGSLGTAFKRDKQEFLNLKNAASIANSTLNEFIARNNHIIANGRDFANMSNEVAEVWKEYDKLNAKAEEATAASNNLSNSYTALKGVSWGAVAAIIALGLQIAAFIAQCRLAIRRAQELKQVAADAAKIGMSVQAYQEWGYVLESVGVQADELRGLIQTLSDEQAQMAEGSEGASKAFKQLGLSVSDVVTMSQEQLFVETITRLQEVEDGVVRTRLAYQIFGEDAAHVANIMNMSSEQMSALVNNYRELGGGASAELISKSKTLSLSLGQLRQAWTGLTNALAELVMPFLTAVVNWLTKAIAIVRMFIQTLFGLSSAASSSGSSMSSGMSGYTGSVNEATDAVKKLKREQMGFDELNKLPGKDTDSGSGGGGGLDFGGGGFGGGFELPKIEDLGLDKWREWLAKYKTLIQDLTTWSLIAVGLAMMIIGAGGLSLPMILGGATLAGIGIAVGSADGSTFDRYVARTKEEWAYLKEWFKTVVMPVFTKEFWVNKFAPIKSGFNDSLNSIKLLFSTIWQAIRGWWNGSVAPFFTKAYWVTKFENIRAAASEKLTAVKNAFSTAWTNIKNVFSGWGTFFTNLWDKVKTIFKSVGTSVGNSIAGAVKSVINSILSTVESKINSFITMINNAITVINKIPGVNITKLSKITVPKLATGGIVTQSTLANIGEAGAEAVLPLERNTQWMDTLADKIAARNGAPSKIVLMVDGKELGWASINGINNITKQTGNLQLQLI